jgi:hypothetical protein
MYLNFSFHSVTAIAALLFALSAPASTTTDTDEPQVKLSRNGLCHERGDPYYSATIHFQAFNTLADCVKAGGRELHSRRDGARGSQTKGDTPRTEPIDSKWRWSKYQFSAGLVITVGLGVALLLLVLWSARLRRRGPTALPPRIRYPAPVSGSSPEDRIEVTDTPEGRDLVAACLGDRDTAQRLIQYELDKRPSLSRRAAAAAARARLRRDNR